MMDNNRIAAWAVTLSAMAAVAVMGAGCGGDDSEAGGDAPADPAQAIAAATTPEEKIRATYGAFVDYYYAKDANGICGLTSTAEIRAFGKTPCVPYFTNTLSQGTVSPNRPRIVRLTIDGSKAHAKVKTKTSNEYPIRFVLEDDDWKIADGLLPDDFDPNVTFGGGGGPKTPDSSGSPQG